MALRILYAVLFLLLIPAAGALVGYSLFNWVPQVQKLAFSVAERLLETNNYLAHIKSLAGPAWYSAFVATIFGFICGVFHRGKARKEGIKTLYKAEK